MQVNIAPDLVALLSTTEADEQSEVLLRLWHEVQKEIEQQKPKSITTPTEVRVPKRARFSFD